MVTNTPMRQAITPSRLIKKFTTSRPNRAHHRFVTTLRLSSIASQKSIRLSTINKYVNLYMAATTSPGMIHRSVPANVKSPMSRDATKVGTNKLNP